jgi:hypothetical protein
VFADFVEEAMKRTAGRTTEEFVKAPWLPAGESESPAMEEKLKALKVTVRCVPLNGENEPGKCLFTGQPSERRGVFAKSY